MPPLGIINNPGTDVHGKGIVFHRNGHLSGFRVSAILFELFCQQVDGFCQVLFRSGKHGE
jgi:hypothetical protein